MEIFQYIIANWHYCGVELSFVELRRKRKVIPEKDLRGIGKAQSQTIVQELAKRRSPGWVNFVAAVAYHFCLAMPVAFTQSGAHLLAGP